MANSVINDATTGRKAESCGTCRFRMPDDRPEYSTSGQCRRFPPIIVEQVALDGSGANHYSQHWPWMAADDWCGEYARG